MEFGALELDLDGFFGTAPRILLTKADSLRRHKGCVTVSTISWFAARQHPFAALQYRPLEISALLTSDAGDSSLGTTGANLDRGLAGAVTSGVVCSHCSRRRPEPAKWKLTLDMDSAIRIVGRQFATSTIVVGRLWDAANLRASLRLRTHQPHSGRICTVQIASRL